MDKNGFYWKKWLGAFLFGVALITVYKTFDNLTEIFKTISGIISLFTPFIIGFILAFFLYPATLSVERKLSGSKKKWIVKHKKTVSVLSVYFSFVALIVLAFSVILPRLSASVTDFFMKLPEYLTEIELFMGSISKEGGILERFHLDGLVESFDIKAIMQSIFMQDAWSYVKGFKDVTDVLMDWLMGIVICAYALLEKESLFRLIRALFGLVMKQNTMDRVGAYVGKISGIFYKFFFGKMIDSFVIGILALIGFTILKVPYGALMAVVVMVFNMIPYFGPFIGAIPAVLVSLLVGGIYPAIWTTLFIFVLQQFDGIWLGPKILGNSVGVSPFWVIFAILIFGGMFGIWGMIFGVPAIAALRMLMSDYMDDGKLNLSVGIGKKSEETDK